MGMSHKQLREAGVLVPPKPKCGRAATSGGSPGSVAGAHLLAYCRARGYPEPVPEHPFHPVRDWRFDWCWPAERVALEVEGVTREGGRHQRVEGYSDDAVKYTMASLMGWRLIRCTPAMIRDGRVFQFLDLAFGGQGG